jgi:hypothetical protein
VEWRAWLTPPPLQVSTGAAPLCIILPPPTLSWTAQSGPPLPQYHLPRAAVRSSGAHQPHRQAPRSLLRRETPPPKPPSRRPMNSVSHRRYLLAWRDPHIPLMLESPPSFIAPPGCSVIARHALTSLRAWLGQPGRLTCGPSQQAKALGQNGGPVLFQLFNFLNQFSI